MLSLVRAAGIVLLLTGCTPTYLEAALVHQSHPDAGPGPWPMGGPSDETTIDGIEGTAGWSKGIWFGEASLMWDARERNLEGGPWTATFKTGVRIRP